VNTPVAYELFRDFIHERFAEPRAKVLTTALIEDDFLAWGALESYMAATGLTTMSLCYQASSRRFPQTWPALHVDPRTARSSRTREP
jgi:hypothetical protein